MATMNAPGQQSAVKTDIDGIILQLLSVKDTAGKQVLIPATIQFFTTAHSFITENNT